MVLPVPVAGDTGHVAAHDTIAGILNDPATNWPQGNATYLTLPARFLAAAMRDVGLEVPGLSQLPPTIAYSSSASPLAVENLIQSGPFALTGVQAFTYTTYDAAGYVSPTAVGSETTPMWIAFDTDATTLDVRYIGNTAPAYRLMVDGEYVTPFQQTAGGAGSGAKWRLNIVFPTKKMRRLIIESSGLFVRSVYTAATDTIIPAPLPPLSLGALTDSYGVGGDLDNMFHVAARALGVAPLVNASGGSGFSTAGNSSKYETRLSGLLAANPSVLVALGGINDGTATLQADVSSLVTAAKASKPAMPVVIVGSEAPPGTTSAATKSALLKAGAAAAGAFFFDMTTGHVYNAAGGLIQAGSPVISGTGHVGGATGDGNADFYIDPDTIHPYRTTDTTVPDGWVYHGLRLAAALQACLAVGA